MRYPQITVRRNDMDCSYDITYKHQQYGASIKVSREMLEDRMATAYSSGDIENQLQYYAYNQLQQQASHNHNLYGSALGGLGSTWTSGTVTTSGTSDGDWAYINTNPTINGAQIDKVWFDEAVERKVSEMDKKKQTPKRATKGHWPNRWYRVNEDMSPREFGLGIYEPEPLDDLRKEIGEWLYENQN